MYCYIFSDYMQCRFTVLKPGIQNSMKKTSKTFQYLIIKLSNVSAEDTPTIVIMSVLDKKIYLFSSIFWLRNKSNLPFEYFILETYA